MPAVREALETWLNKVNEDLVTASAKLVDAQDRLALFEKKVVQLTQDRDEISAHLQGLNSDGS